MSRSSTTIHLLVLITSIYLFTSLAIAGNPSSKEPAWIAYASEGKENVIYLHNLRTNKRRVVRANKTPGHDLRCLQWSSDGSQLTFISDTRRPEFSELVQYDPMANRQTAISLREEINDYCRSVCVDPSGKHVAFFDSVSKLVVARVSDGTRLLEKPLKCEEVGSVTWTGHRSRAILLVCDRKLIMVKLDGMLKIFQTKRSIHSVLGWVPGRRRYLMKLVAVSGEAEGNYYKTEPAFFHPWTGVIEMIRAPQGSWEQYKVLAINKAGRVLILDKSDETRSRLYTWRIGQKRANAWYSRPYIAVTTLQPPIHSGTVALVLKDSNFLSPGGDLHVVRVGHKIGTPLIRADRPSLEDTIFYEHPALRP